MIEVKAKKRTGTIIYHILVCGFGLLMLYPLFWMFMSSFKDTNTIFTTARSLIPDPFTLENYANGWKGFAGVSFATFFKNSLFVAVLGTIGTLASSACVAFGFARCQFKGKKLLFGAMLASMMLPGQILMVPQYLWYEKLGWVGSFAPLIVPFCFAIQGFFVYLMMNFIQGIPRELDEAAKIDGCNSVQTLVKVIVPMLSPAITSIALFQFMWSSNDFMGPLLYVNTPAKYPLAIFVKLSMDADAGFSWNRILALSLISILPSLIIFFLAQDKFVDGISAGGVKG